MTIIEPRARRWLIFLVLASGPAWADPGVRIGSRGGLDLQGDGDPYVGVDLRLSLPRTPLTINPAFDYVFDEKMTMYQLSFNALYYLPVPIGRVDPYVGVGATVTAFSLKESM